MEHALVVLWKHLEELTGSFWPVVKDALTPLGTGQRNMLLDLSFDLFHLVVATLDELVNVDHVGIQAVLHEVAGFIIDVSNTTGHAGTEVAAGATEVDDHAASHVFKRVITDTFDDGFDARVPHTETFAGHACDVSFALGGTVEANVTSDDIFMRDKR